VQSDDSETDQSEQCASSIEDVEVESSSRGASRRGRGRGRGRGGRKKSSRGLPVVYRPREMFVGLTDPSYFWVANKAIPCKLCMYEGKKIVEHYVNKHPASEVIISRLTREEATHAILQPKVTASPVLQCRFCTVSCTTIREFQDHVTEHTGEYRYLCPFCTYKKSRSATVSQHIKTAHHDNITTPDLLEEAPDNGDQYLAGYMCGFCNFVQMNELGVQQHIDLRHRHEPGAVCSPGLEEVNEINMSKVIRQDDILSSEALPVVIKKEKEVIVRAIFIYLNTVLKKLPIKEERLIECEFVCFSGAL